MKADCLISLSPDIDVRIRRVIDDLVDEVVSAERGKPKPRLARKAHAKGHAVNRIMGLLG